MVFPIYWHLTRTSLSPPDADAMRLEGMQPFLNPTVQTFCLNIRAIAQHDVVCEAKEFREELIGGSPQVGCKTMQAWSPRNQLIWGDGRGYTLDMSPGQHNTEGQTNIARTYRKFYACQSASMSMSQGSWSITRGLIQTQVIGNIDHIDKALFLPLDNMNNSSMNHQWLVHVSLLQEAQQLQGKPLMD